MLYAIFIRSYYKDFGCLEYCLRSIDQYCRGFRDVVLVVPQSSTQRLIKKGLRRDHTVICRDYRDDYLGQQATKLLADTITDADYICHVDSDCIFHSPFQPLDLFKAGKLEFLMTPYDQFPLQARWQETTQKCLQRNVEYDFMRQQPFMFPRWIYSAFRDHITNLHGTNIESYITAQPPRGFSEYNALGAYAYYYHREQFIWREVSIEEPSEHFCRWYWSWGGIQPHVRREIEKILK
jgi:hypothetical protein